MENIHIVYISIFLVLLMICFVCKFLTYDPVHTKFPQTAIIKSYIHQYLLLDGITVNAEDFKICDATDITNEIYFEAKPSHASKLAVVTLNIMNTTGNKMYFDLPSVTLESGNWIQSLSMDLFFELNKNFDSVIHPGRNISIRVPFALYEAQFSSKEWKNIFGREFDIIFELDPKKKFISLKAMNF